MSLADDQRAEEDYVRITRDGRFDYDVPYTSYSMTHHTRRADGSPVPMSSVDLIREQAARTRRLTLFCVQCGARGLALDRSRLVAGDAGGDAWLLVEARADDLPGAEATTMRRFMPLVCVRCGAVFYMDVLSSRPGHATQRVEQQVPQIDTPAPARELDLRPPGSVDEAPPSQPPTQWVFLCQGTYTLQDAVGRVYTQNADGRLIELPSATGTGTGQVVLSGTVVYQCDDCNRQFSAGQLDTRCRIPIHDDPRAPVVRQCRGSGRQLISGSGVGAPIGQTLYPCAECYYTFTASELVDGCIPAHDEPRRIPRSGVGAAIVSCRGSGRSVIQQTRPIRRAPDAEFDYQCVRCSRVFEQVDIPAHGSCPAGRAARVRRAWVGYGAEPPDAVDPVVDTWHGPPPGIAGLTPLVKWGCSQCRASWHRHELSGTTTTPAHPVFGSDNPLPCGGSGLMLMPCMVDQMSGAWVGYVAEPPAPSSPPNASPVFAGTFAAGSQISAAADLMCPRCPATWRSDQLLSNSTTPAHPVYGSNHPALCDGTGQALVRRSVAADGRWSNQPSTRGTNNPHDVYGGHD